MKATMAMRRELMLTTDPIDEAALTAGRSHSPSMGAVVYFAGVVREKEGEGTIVGLEYEAYREMAAHQFELIFREVEKRWPVASVRLVHRLGMVPVNEASLWVELVAPHRREAFEACQYVIDEMKRVVPIWKRPVGGG